MANVSFVFTGEVKTVALLCGYTEIHSLKIFSDSHGGEKEKQGPQIIYPPFVKVTSGILT